MIGCLTLLLGQNENENVESLYGETWLNDDNCPPNQNKHDDLFSKKRQKLHQWVADISYPEIEDLCSKGLEYIILDKLFLLLYASDHGVDGNFSGMISFLCSSVGYFQ